MGFPETPVGVGRGEAQEKPEVPANTGHMSNWYLEKIQDKYTATVSLCYRGELNGQGRETTIGEPLPC